MDRGYHIHDIYAGRIAGQVDQEEPEGRRQARFSLQRAANQRCIQRKSGVRGIMRARGGRRGRAHCQYRCQGLVLCQIYLGESLYMNWTIGDIPGCYEHQNLH